MTDTKPQPAVEVDELVFEQTSLPVNQGTVEAVSEDTDVSRIAAADDTDPTTSITGSAVPASSAPTWTYDPDAAQLPPPPPPVGAAVATAASLGIVGKHRMPALVIVLTVVTLGFYGLVWHSRINREMSDFDTRMHVHAGRSTWAIVPPWLLGLAASVAGVVVLFSAGLRVAVPFDLPVSPTGWILLAGVGVIPLLEFLIPFSVIAVAMTAERVRVCEDRVGLTTDVQLRPVANVAWLLFPVVGGLILMARLQSRLNQVWERVAPPASRRRR